MSTTAYEEAAFYKLTATGAAVTLRVTNNHSMNGLAEVFTVYNKLNTS
jgi:hypothetical protein